MYKYLVLPALIAVMQMKRVDSTYPNLLNMIPDDNHEPYDQYDNHYGPNYHNEIHVDPLGDLIEVLKLKMKELHLINKAVKDKLLKEKFFGKEKFDLQLHKKDFIKDDHYDHVYQSYQYPVPAYTAPPTYGVPSYSHPSYKEHQESYEPYQLKHKHN